MGQIDYDIMTMDPFSDDIEPPDERRACKFCGKDDLIWVEMPNGSWRLVDEKNVIHSCTSYRS